MNMIEILLKHRQQMVIFWKQRKLLGTIASYYLGVSEIIGVLVNQDICLIIYLFISALFTT